MSLQKFIDTTVKAKVENFYKRFIIKSKSGREDYYTTEEYFKKFGGDVSQFKTSWAYKEYVKWFNSETYTKDIEAIKREFLQDILIGFDSRMEEIINMTDDDDEDLNKWIEMRDYFSNLKTDAEKIDYLDQQYKNNYYYPTFSYIWLYCHFENRIPDYSSD
jgi:hypothetical protein